MNLFTGAFSKQNLKAVESVPGDDPKGSIRDQNQGRPVRALCEAYRP